MVGGQARCQEDAVKKGPWSQEEDQKLTEYINKYGHGNWRNLPKLVGLLRGGKNCRLRWANNLRPGIKRGPFSSHEDEIILDYHHKLGNKWSEIAKQLPGRTDNDIKNRWYNRLKKGVRNSMAYKRLSPPLTASSLARLEVEAGIGRNVLNLAANGNVHLGHSLLMSAFQSNEMVESSVALNFVHQEQHQLLSYDCQRLDNNFMAEDQLFPSSTQFNAVMLNDDGGNNFLPTENNTEDYISALLSSTYNGGGFSSFPLLDMSSYGESIPQESYLEFTQFPQISQEIVESPTFTDF
ncbi:hypothetical protein SUGI_0779530 [Cryptomeria japonica]|uniref:transcription factor MYB13-like n=1 Tax=Cryptomeria japonica TaxID=3369 RepID=UPI002414BC6E|nr:transcription factor MYB13-like [Cryptomeria japonica]GLJ38292.1 hypothetical protein SUGI_0779530 [Cryptomeria japonica]